MTWAKLIHDIAVVFGTLIGILDHQLHGRASCSAFKDAR